MISTFIRFNGINILIFKLSAAALQFVEHRASDRKVADPWFDSRTGNVSLCSWERQFMHIFRWGRSGPS